MNDYPGHGTLRYFLSYVASIAMITVGLVFIDGASFIAVWGIIWMVHNEFTHLRNGGWRKDQ